MDNKALWAKVSKTDPKQVKAITGKQYQGNSPKPYYLIEKATEVFGPVGIGWGVVVKSERFERLGDDDVLHVAVVSVWYVLDGKRTETFDQMGGTKAAYRTSAGKLMVDEDAGKKSVTDGMVKCLSMIGFAGDIFSGRWDDSKYVAELRKEFEEPKPDATGSLEPILQASIDQVKARKGVAQDVLATSPQLSATKKARMEWLSTKVIEAFDSYGAQAAFERIEQEDLNETERIFLDTFFPSDMRAKIKAYSIEFHSKATT